MRARLKRRLVRELVADNVALRAGTPPPSRRRRGSALLALAPVLALALVPAGWVLASYLGQPKVTEMTAAAVDAEPAAPVTAQAAADGSERWLRSVATERLAAPTAEAAAALDTSVFPLAVEHVMLDPGHGGASGGTRTPDGLTEKDLALDIARRVARYLESYRFQVSMTRDADVDVTLRERTRMANDSRADLFVSIHLNWIANRRVRGVETYYLGATEDPFLSQLAAMENRDSGFSLTDFKGLVEEVYVGVRQDESQRLAAAVQASLLGSLRAVNPEVEDRGVKTAPFIVLMETEMPAILAEVSCLSNEREAELLTRPLYREHIAEAVALGIRSYAESLANPDLRGMSS